MHYVKAGIILVVAMLALQCESADLLAAAAAAASGQTCRWVGTAPFCQMGCESGENEMEKSACGDGACCWSGYKLRCCKPIVQPVIVQAKS
ncbi:hypothetical protein RvY_03649 [Ramazzottius varieornatus]|uniref:Uncharacterized protein n=1 Tax=Ramazzottius varieornatus TaxID=947166 RepID=A0A1D1UNU5_RAMVA|nr:hypothetical protein RvY_03649 [Ramazzottius varieornatus]